MQEYEKRVHIVPDTESGHVLSEDCFCEPKPDEETPEMIIHRDEIDRIPFE